MEVPGGGSEGYHVLKVNCIPTARGYQNNVYCSRLSKLDCSQRRAQIDIRF